MPDSVRLVDGVVSDDILERGDADGEVVCWRGERWGGRVLEGGCWVLDAGCWSPTRR